MAKANMDKQGVVYLTLSADEAKTLRDILSNIAGKMSSRRGDAEKMFKALGDAGVRSLFDEDFEMPTDYDGTITFKG